MRLLKPRTAHSHGHDTEDRLTVWYRRAMDRLIGSPRYRWCFLSGVAVLLACLAVNLVGDWLRDVLDPR